MIAKILTKYLRYQPVPSRPKGKGAFVDFAEAAAARGEPKLKSSSLRRPPLKPVRTEPEAE